MLKGLIEDFNQDILEEIPEIFNAGSNAFQQLIGTIVDLKKDPMSVLEALAKTCQENTPISLDSLTRTLQDLQLHQNLNPMAILSMLRQ